MTSITFLRPERPSPAARLLSPLARLPRRFARQLKAWRDRRETVAALEALPYAMLKDIGWPGSDSDPRSRAPRADGGGRHA